MRFLYVFWMLALCHLLALPASATATTWHLTKVQMVSRESGWALASTPRGSVLLRTGDSGGDWQNVSPSSVWPLGPPQIAANQDYGIGWEGIDFYSLSRQTCWVVMIDESKNSIIVEQTHDDGRHWGKSQFADRSGISPSVSFLDTNHGWILTTSDMASGSTRKELYRTKDGGQTWAAVTDALPDHIDPYGMKFRSASEGWLAAGYHGSDEMPFYRTDDAGRHWHLQEIDMPPLFQNGYGIISLPSFFGTSRRAGLLSVQFRNKAPFGERFALYRTQDAGNTWHLRRWLPRSAGMDAISFVSPNMGWMLKDKDSRYPILQLTSDSGRHWQTVYPR